MYVRRGIDPVVAEDMANQVMRDPDLALETHAREEMGISIGRLGSPWQVVPPRFVTFARGAFIPLLPWLIGSGTAAIVGSIVLGAVAAVVVSGCGAGVVHRAVEAARRPCGSWR